MPCAQASAGFEQNRSRLSEELIRRMNARLYVDLLIGSGNQAMMKNNSRNFCRFTSTLFAILAGTSHLNPGREMPAHEKPLLFSRRVNPLFTHPPEEVFR